MASSLEKIANVLLIAACTVVIGEYGYRMIPKPSQPAGEFRAGAHLPGSAAMALNSSQRTLVMATTSSCQFCNASMPFYKRVAELAHQTGTRIVAVTPETPEANRAFLESHGLAVDVVLAQSVSGILVPHLPTLILVRRDGTIISAWEGQPRDDIQRSIMEALRKS